MKYNLEQRAANFVTANVHLAELQMLLGKAKEIGDNDLTATVERLLAEAGVTLAMSKAMFWQAFKYPLQIFDLKKGEKPDVGELVNAYDEVTQTWDYLCFNGHLFLNPLLDHRQLDVDRFHRWVRLPVLETE